MKVFMHNYKIYTNILNVWHLEQIIKIANKYLIKEILLKLV